MNRDADSAVQQAFRDVMSGVCTPVSVVTAAHDGRAHGTTVSAFASLSMNPPMVLVSLDRGSDLLAMVRETRSFGVNVLAAEQSALAAQLATKAQDKFAAVEWRSDHGLPRIDGATGWLACSVAEFVDGGDHVVLLGNVLAAAHDAADPLTYHLRQFGTHTRLSA